MLPNGVKAVDFSNAGVTVPVLFLVKVALNKPIVIVPEEPAQDAHPVQFFNTPAAGIIYPPDFKNSKMHVGYEDEQAMASKETEVECPHCSGEGRMAMSFGYGAGVGTCRNCGGKGKGTEFHYTDTEGNMKKSWQTWLESKKDQGQGDARYGNPHETGMEDPRKLQTTKDDFSMEEKKMLKKMHKNNGKPYIQIE